MSNLLIWMIKDCAESKLFWWFKEGATHFSDFPVAADLLYTAANVAPGWNEQDFRKIFFQIRKNICYRPPPTSTGTSKPLPNIGFDFIEKRFQ